MHCKQCLQEREAKERAVALARRQAQGKDDDGNDSNNARVKCASCKLDLSSDSFNRNQLSKKEKARCRACVEKALKLESENLQTSKQQKIDAAKKKLKDAEQKGNALEISVAASELAALEAEHVTGLKPMVLGRGSGRRRGGRGAGRGRTSFNKR